MPLEEYRAKRDPARTPEPVPDQSAGGAADHTGDEQAGRGDTFVVQEHHATALHWDVRLERDGGLVSWAVPKGLPLDPKANRLAKQTEDHPLAYATFGGDIPRGEYGGGHVSVWDSGTYELEKWREREVMVVLHGTKVDGRYVFFRTRGRDWMVHRMDPPPEGWSPLPTGLTPMQATVGPLPTGDQWSCEAAWEGVRVLVAVDGGRPVAVSEGSEVTSSYPELRALGLQLGSRQVLLDGWLVVPADPGLILSRSASAKPGRALLRDAPVHLMLTDLLHVEGRSLLASPHDDRRTALEALDLAGPSWSVPPAYPGTGRAVLDAVRAQGLPGVLSTLRTSPYEPGVASAARVSTRA